MTATAKQIQELFHKMAALPPEEGIVHRDLKPANVLVTMVDGKPVPKVIDFGVAKAFGVNITDETMTQFGSVVGTGPRTPGEAIVWDTQTGEQTVVIKGFKGSVNSVAFSPDGKRFVTAGIGIPKGPGPRGTGTALNSGAVTIWDAQTGESLVELKGLEEGVNSVAFSPDGARIVTAGYENGILAPHAVKGTELKIWDAKTGTLIHDLTEQTPYKYGLVDGVRGGSAVFSLDGRWIVARGVRRGEGNRANFVFAWTGVVSVWNAQTGEHVRDLGGRRDTVTSLAFSRDGKWIVTGGAPTRRRDRRLCRRAINMAATRTTSSSPQAALATEFVF